MRHDVRRVEVGRCATAALDAVVLAGHHQARGDAVVVLTPRLDDEGRPTGNREERRRAARILRQRTREKA